MDEKPSPYTILAEAKAVPSDAERASYLDLVCGDDPALRAEVESLLSSDQPGDFLDVPLFEPRRDEQAHRQEPPETGDFLDKSPVPSPTPVEGTGSMTVGPYRLLRKLGEGGMGTVFLAEQDRPVRRKVALKIIKEGIKSDEVIARFEAERQALAMMDHPNIARVLEAGATDSGRLYFVMELVEGPSITEYCDAHRLAPRKRIDLFIEVCQAIEHAHQKGIIHRDIKPSNVLVTEVDGRPVPKVIDFGVAKAIGTQLIEGTPATEFGSVIGTPEYMSPEQASLGSVDVDTRSDVYSLGVLLYELLTGSTPLNRGEVIKAALLELLRQIREVEPPAPSNRLSGLKESLAPVADARGLEPSRLTRLVSGDLDWVVMKALEKDRDRRYKSASELVQDLRCYLVGDPVTVGPPSKIYRVRKYARKHRVALAITSAFVLMLLAATGISLRLAYLASIQLERAEDRERLAIDAVKRFRDAVANEPALRNSPQLEELRKRLLKEPMPFFRSLRDRLQIDRNTRTESLVRLAKATNDLAHLADEIGDKHDALVLLRESLEIYKKLTVAYPTVTEFQSDLADTHNDVGVLLSDTGDVIGAMKSHELALAIFKMLAEANPAATQFQSDLADSYNNIGVLLGDTGDAAGALKSHTSALAICVRLAEANPSATQFQSNLASSHNNIGVLLGDTGDAAGALKSYESSLAVRLKLAEANPTVTEFQCDLADSYNNMGFLLSETGDAAGALKSHESALDLFKTLAEAHPSATQFQNGMARSHGFIGALQSEAGDVAGAMKSCQSSLAVRLKLAEANPTVTEFQRDLASSHDNIGNLLDEMGDAAGAMKSRQSSLAVRLRLAEANPTVTEFQCHLATSYYNLGNLLDEMGDAAGALKSHESALAVRLRLAEANPTVTEFQSHLAASHTNIGYLLSRTGNAVGAFNSLKSAMSMFVHLFNEHPKQPEFCHALGITLNGLALIDLKKKQFVEARRRLREAIDWHKKALSLNPKNTDYRRGYTDGLVSLLRATIGLGDTEGAAEVERELTTFRDSDPINVALDARLQVVRRGEQPPKDNTERLRLAQRAYDKKLYAVASRLREEALDTDPKLADNREAEHRYNAACAAALAGCGRSKDIPTPDEATKAGLRRRAREWLLQELGVWAKLADGGAEQDRQVVSLRLAQWKEDGDLAGIRDADPLSLLPELEKVEFGRLWHEVDKLLADTSKAR